MGLTPEGMQPFRLGGDYLVCNGEIYGFRPLKRQLQERGYSFQSGSDCESRATLLGFPQRGTYPAPGISCAQRRAEAPPA